MSTAAARKELMSKKLAGMRQIPTIPAVLMRLLEYLRQPTESLDIQKVSEMISQDNALAVQCLQMANSPLFARRKSVDTLRGAIMSLGIRHVSDIAMSCGLLSVLPTAAAGLDPVVLWEHSLGCALISGHLARKAGFSDPSKAYLAGLLHDLGLIVNLWVLPEEFKAAYELARQEGIPLHEAEARTLGFTHCDSGRLLAEQWSLSPDLVDVVAFHHLDQSASEHGALITIVRLSDILCRMSSLNYGYVEACQVDISQEDGFAPLVRQFPAMAGMDWARLTFELDSYMDEVKQLVQAVYRKR